MTQQVTRSEVREALDQLVVEGVLEVVLPCLVVVPESWRELLPSGAFDKPEPVYRLTVDGKSLAQPKMPDRLNQK